MTSRRRILLLGWFSFPAMGATAGDLLVRDLVAGWLKEAHVRFDVALAEPFTGGVDWQAVEPTAYTDLVFVCGPFGNGYPITDLLARFAGCRLHGLDLTVLQPLAEWNPFTQLIERDSDRTSRPDLVFLSEHRPVPVVGVVLVHPQQEYGDRGLHSAANAAIEELLSGREVACVAIDTRLDVNEGLLRSPAQVEALIARMDVIVTTRLHGLVLALKNGLPALAIDPIAGGGKVKRQADSLGWPIVFTADALDQGELSTAMDFCLKIEAMRLARQSRQRAARLLAPLREEFLRGLRPPAAHAKAG